MTPQEFQLNHSGDLKNFIETPVGKQFISLLNGMRPPLSAAFPNEHSMIRTYANIEGYELCLRNIIALMMAPSKPKTGIPADYGVPDKKTEPVEGTTETK